ncbi:MAG: MFS transporter [Alphaproteobacteria bacterium]|nr:MFS transporter [Alphaproteobacteria bacterium]
MIRLATGWITLFVMGTDLFVISPLLPAIATDFATSAALAGLSVTLFSIVYMVVAPMLGHIADRFGRLNTLTTCLIVFGVANALTALAGSFAWLLAARLIAGAAAAGVSPSVYALVGEAAPTGRRATWLGVAVSGLLLSLSIGTPIGTVAGEAFGWRAVFLGLAPASVALAILNRILWAGKSFGSRPGTAASTRAPGYSALARRLAPTIVWATALYSMYTYLGTGLRDFGYSAGQIATTLVAYGAGAIVGTLAGGRIADWRGVKFATGLAIAGLGAALLALAAALSSGGPVALLLGILSAAAQIFFPAQQAGLANDFGDQRATVLAWNNSALFLGISLGSLLGGQAMAQGGFTADVLTAGGIALFAWLVNAAVVPGRTARPSGA